MSSDTVINEDVVTTDPVPFMMQHLQSEGFQASIDSDGDIVFRCEGIGYALCFDKTDTQFAKLLLPNVYRIENQNDLDRTLRMLDNVNRRMKVAKGYTIEDRVWLSVEIWLTDQTEWTVFLRRAVRLLALSARLFSEGMEDPPPVRLVHN